MYHEEDYLGVLLHPLALLPTLIRGKQTDAAFLTSLPSPLMRSQHPINKKKEFLQSFLPFLVSAEGPTQAVRKAPPGFLCDSPCREKEGVAPQLSCSAHLPFIFFSPLFPHCHTLPFLPPTFPSPNISLEPDGCKVCVWMKESREREGCLWLSVPSAWFRSLSGLGRSFSFHVDGENGKSGGAWGELTREMRQR